MKVRIRYGVDAGRILEVPNDIAATLLADGRAAAVTEKELAQAGIETEMKAPAASTETAVKNRKKITK